MRRVTKTLQVNPHLCCPHVMTSIANSNSLSFQIQEIVTLINHVYKNFQVTFHSKMSYIHPPNHDQA
jgi:hypothetical protein